MHRDPSAHLSIVTLRSLILLYVLNVKSARWYRSTRNLVTQITSGEQTTLHRQGRDEPGSSTSDFVVVSSISAIVKPYNLSQHTQQITSKV